MSSLNVEAVRLAAQLALQLAEKLVTQLAALTLGSRALMSTWKRLGRSARFRCAAAGDAANSAANCSTGSVDDNASN